MPNGLESHQKRAVRFDAAPKLEAPAIDLQALAQTRAEYSSNKVRKQERWFDWTSNEDSLDSLMKSGRARRSVDPVPFDTFERAITPHVKRYESDSIYSKTAAAYSISRREAEKNKTSKRTSIFGGMQQTPSLKVSEGKSWSNLWVEPEVPAELDRNSKLDAKYQTSSFPSRYEKFCDQEYRRMSRRALGLA